MRGKSKPIKKQSLASVKRDVSAMLSLCGDLDHSVSYWQKESKRRDKTKRRK